MGELIKGQGGGVVGLIHGKGEGGVVPKPFEREIFLFDTHVAGTGYIVGIEDLEPYLQVEDRLDFFREPENRFDPKAIVVKTRDGVKIGYVPRVDNVIFSRLMDAGKLLFGRISSKKMSGKWLSVSIKVYLHD